MYKAYIVEIKELRPHPNADRLQIATFFGNDVCISLDAKIGDKGIYFPTDGQLSVEYCVENHLCRRKPDGTEDTGYMDSDKRNVTAIRLRGEKSDGLYAPISSLEFTGVNLDELNVGDTIDVVNGIEICRKYIPRGNKVRSNTSEGNRTRKKTAPIAPLFAEHADTEQLAYNLSAFRPGDQIEITLKMHGTSGRTGYLPTLQKYKRTLMDRLLRREGTPVYDWGYVTGTRRTIVKDSAGGFYGSNAFREQHAKLFEGKLWKGETVYYELVGFTDLEQPIMGTGKNVKVGKDFVKQYGDITVFSYGCSPTGKEGIEVDVPQSDIYVYRMTMTTEDGNVIDYTPDFVRYRCEQMGVKTVPVFWKGFIPTDGHDYPSAGDWVKGLAESYYDGPDPIGKTHIREGVVVRVVNRPKFSAYKHKNFSFKVLEGIVKADADAPDMEEAEDLK